MTLQNNTHFSLFSLPLFPFVLFSLQMYDVTYIYSYSFPSSLISSKYILVLQWGTQGEVNIFHFSDFQRSFLSVHKGQNTKLLNERWEDFCHSREYKPAVASLTLKRLSYVNTFSCAIYDGKKTQVTQGIKK